MEPKSPRIFGQQGRTAGRGPRVEISSFMCRAEHTRSRATGGYPPSRSNVRTPPSEGWPDDPDTVAEANAHPEVLAHKTVGQVAGHFDEIVRGLKRKPALVGHSFGGLLAQILAGRGRGAVTVAVDHRLG